MNASTPAHREWSARACCCAMALGLSAAALTACSGRVAQTTAETDGGISAAASASGGGSGGSSASGGVGTADGAAPACEPTYAEISAGLERDSVSMPSAVIDSANDKLLVVATTSVNQEKPGLFRCNLDGTGCTYTDTSAGQGYGSGRYPSAVIDAANGKLLIATTNAANEEKAALFRCDLDGSGCTYSDISAGEGYGSGQVPSVLIDTINSKLLVVTTNWANGGKPALFRCNLDGSGCTYTDISTGRGDSINSYATAVIDTANGKLLVVKEECALGCKPALFRCNLDGSGCTYTDISAGQGAGNGHPPSVVVDSANGKLLVVATNFANAEIARLFRCNLDGSGCTYTDISAGGDRSGWYPSAVIDAANGKLLVATMNSANAERPGLFRCSLDGSGCTYTDISAGAGSSSGLYPCALIDSANARLLVVTSNVANGLPALFSTCLR